MALAFLEESEWVIALRPLGINPNGTVSNSRKLLDALNRGDADGR